MLKNTAIFILTFYSALSAYFIYTPLYPVFDRTEKFERHHYLTSQFPFVGTYLLKKPQNLDRDKRYPLVVALHGGGKGSLGAYVSAGDDFQNRMKAFVLMPMARGNEIWATTDGIINSTEKTDGLANAVEITRSLIEKHPIDVDRVYITGSSNGAIGTFAAIARYSDIFAAGVAVNGIWDKKDAALFRDKEIAVYHGSEDANFPISLMKSLIARIEREGGKPRFIEMEGIGHDSWPAYRDRELWEWLFEQSRSK